jgi:putative endonuclease
MTYIIYWLLSENKYRTYIGFSDKIKRRIMEHKSGKVKTTKGFDKFRCFKLEEVENIEKARIREKYWKSSSGRKKLKEYFIKIK